MAETSLVFNILARDQASSKMDRIKQSMALLGAAAAAMAIKFGKDSVGAFIEAEQAQNRLSAAFDKFPGLADTNIGRLNKLNATLAQKTRFDDDATASGQAVLAQFGVTGRQLEQLTPLLQDYAAKTGKDLPTAAGDFGKALLGQGRALKSIGLDFVDTGSAAGNFEQLMGGVRAQVGGFAAKEGQTAAGQAAILKNQFGELQEEAGSHLVPALMKVASGLLEVIGFVQRNKEVIVPLVAVLGTLGGIVWAVITAQKAWAAVQAALNVVMSANPIGLVIIAIAALVAGIIFAYQKSETFRSVVDAAFRGVAEAGRFMWNALRDAFVWIVDKFLWVGETIVNAAAKAFGWVPGLGPKLKDAAAKFSEFRDDVNAALGGVRDGVTVTTRIAGGQSAINEIAELRYQIANIPRSVTVGVINKIQNIPAYAGGTRRHPGGLAMVGEEGPELVSLPAGASVTTASETRQLMGTPTGLGASGGTTIVLNVTAPVGSNARAIGGELVDYLRAYVAGNGPLRGLTA